MGDFVSDDTVLSRLVAVASGSHARRPELFVVCTCEMTPCLRNRGDASGDASGDRNMLQGLVLVGIDAGKEPSGAATRIAVHARLYPTLIYSGSLIVQAQR